MSTEMGEMDYTDQEKLYFGAEYYPPARRDVELHLVSVEDTEEERFDRVQAEARFAARRIRALLDEGFPRTAAAHRRTRHGRCSSAPRWCPDIRPP